MNKFIVGIDLGGTSCKMAILDTQGTIIEKWAIRTNCQNHGTQIVPNIIASIQQQLLQLDIMPESLLGIGMGAPGAINREAGTVSGAYNLGWHKAQPIKSLFSQSFACPFYLENDANAAALGEKWQGAGENSSTVVFLTLGTGVGGGIICDNQLVTGAMGCGGEIGHLHASDNPLFTCTCGNTGCLEAVASATGIVKLAQHIKESTGATESTVACLKQGAGTAEDIFSFAKKGDSFALSVVDQFSTYLGIACSHITNMLNPSKIIIGGGMSAAGPFLLEKVATVYHQYVFPKAFKNDTLVLASLQNDAGIIGAAYLVKMNFGGM